MSVIWWDVSGSRLETSLYLPVVCVYPFRKSRVSIKVSLDHWSSSSPPAFGKRVSGWSGCVGQRDWWCYVRLYFLFDGYFFLRIRGYPCFTPILQGYFATLASSFSSVSLTLKVQSSSPWPCLLIFCLGFWWFVEEDQGHPRVEQKHCSQAPML